MEKDLQLTTTKIVFTSAWSNHVVIQKLKLMLLQNLDFSNIRNIKPHTMEMTLLL